MAYQNLTMPSRYYTDPVLYEFEKEQILYKTWQFACHRTAIRDPGCFHTIEIGDESIVVLRDNDDEVRAFYNVCRHRAHRITAGEGQCKRLSCPYHAWTYNLDGTLFHAPGTTEVSGFDADAIQLRSVRTEMFCGLIFVNLDDEAATLEDTFPGLQEEVLSRKPTLADVIGVHEDRISHACNWKVSVENFNECYHCPVVHKYITTNLYSGADYRVSIDGGVVRHFSPRLKNREVHGDLHIWFLWPNLAIQIHPMYHAVSVRHFRSLTYRESEYVYSWYVDPDLPDDHREEVVELGRTYHPTNGVEDQEIVRNVQLGLESRSYDRGPLVMTDIPSVENESAVAYFQSRYLQVIGEQ